MCQGSWLIWIRVYLHEKNPSRIGNTIRRTTEIAKGCFPFIYLGYPIFYGRKKKEYFEEIVKKVMKRLTLCLHKLLTFGGRYVLIAHVLQSMPTYVLSSMISLLELRISIEFLGIICFTQWKRVVLVLDHYIPWIKNCVPSYG